MAGSIYIDRVGIPPEHRFNTDKVGRGNEHTNVFRDLDRAVCIRIGAFAMKAGLSVLPAEGTFEEPDFLAFAHSVADGVECLVDTGATISMFRSEIDEELGLEPDGGEIEDEPVGAFGGESVECCRCKHVVYLDIGPYPIPVPVRFPVRPVKKGAALEYEWVEGFPSENILGMESVLSRRMLCFTPDYLYAFEHRP